MHDTEFRTISTIISVLGLNFNLNFPVNSYRGQNYNHFCPRVKLQSRLADTEVRTTSFFVLGLNFSPDSLTQRSELQAFLS